MHRNFQKLQLANVRACDVRRLLELILEIATAERENPTRPPVGCMILIQPSRHVLPFFVRRRTDLVLAIYECPQERIDAGTVPLLWANMTPCDACHDGCTGGCSGDLPVEICVGERFPLLPMDVYMLFVDELRLDLRTCGEPPTVWIPICDRASEPLACAEEAEEAEDAAAAPTAIWPIPAPTSRRAFSTPPPALTGCSARCARSTTCSTPTSSTTALWRNTRRRTAASRRTPRVTYARITDRCRRRILGERNGDAGEGAAAG